MSTSSIVPRLGPRLQRPGRTAEREGSAGRVVTHYSEQHSQALDVLGEFVAGHERRAAAAAGPLVVMHGPDEGAAERRAARNKILAYFGVMALVLALGTLLKPRAVATAQPADVAAETSPIGEVVNHGTQIELLSQPETKAPVKLPEVSTGDARDQAAVLTVGEHTFSEVAPEQSAALTAPGEQRQAKMSHYWPPLGGVNCAVFRDGQCVSNMASGLPWWAWVGRAAACPVELPFWTTVTLPGGETFVCLDRGGKIVTTAAGELWIDLLVQSPPVPYGAVMPVIVRYPWSEGQ